MAKIDTLCEVRVQNVFQILVSGLKYVQTTPRQVLMTMEFRYKICFFVSVKLEMKKTRFLCVFERPKSAISNFSRKAIQRTASRLWVGPTRVIQHGKYQFPGTFHVIDLSCRKFQIGGSAPHSHRGGSLNRFFRHVAPFYWIFSFFFGFTTWFPIDIRSFGARGTCSKMLHSLLESAADPEIEFYD